MTRVPISRTIKLLLLATAACGSPDHVLSPVAEAPPSSALSAPSAPTPQVIGEFRVAREGGAATTREVPLSLAPGHEFRLTVSSPSSQGLNALVMLGRDTILDYPSDGKNTLPLVRDFIGSGNIVLQISLTGKPASAVDVTLEDLNPVTLLFQDDFSHGLGNWVPHVSDGLGGWWTQDEELFGDYNIGCGGSYCPQADLLLADQFQPGDVNWRIEVQTGLVQGYCCYNGGSMVNVGKLLLFASPAEKEDIEIGYGWTGTAADVPATETRALVGHQRYVPWTQVGWEEASVEPWNPFGWQTVALERHGDVYMAYFNGQLLYTTTRTFSTTPRIGLHTYAAVRMDNFKLYRLP